MKPGPRIPDYQSLQFSWLVKLRWGATGGQLAIILLVHFGLAIPLPLLPLCGIVALEALSNLACAEILRRGAFRFGESSMGWVMVLDVLILTALLFFSGGPMNPFSFLYLVQIALGAVVLRPRWTWALVALSLACFGGLFFAHVDLPGAGGMAHHMEHEQLHLQGMWVAFGVAAGFIVYFVQRVTSSLADRELELGAQRAKSDKLASLATLAAGAAHELSTPLSTIAVVAKELERALANNGALDPLSADAKLIREQVERCRAVLVQMSDDAGAGTGEPITEIEVGALIEEALSTLEERSRIAIVGSAGSAGRLLGPSRALSRAVRALAKNALQASPPGATVELSIRRELGGVWIEVSDHGSGMSGDVLARAGEPFFTTKAPGQGMGLGLFLSRTVIEGLGGRLELSSTPGAGTVARLMLPAVQP